VAFFLPMIGFDMMTTADQKLAYFLDLEPEVDDFRSAVIEGLSSAQKWVPPKFFYDAEGSKLFDKICDLDEYYVTRTELFLLNTHGEEIGSCIGPRARIIEYGCGSSLKIRALLDALNDPTDYVAIDISREHLRMTAEGIAVDYPSLSVGAVCADFSMRLDLPERQESSAGRTVAFFPGSTIGNQIPSEAREFLVRVRQEIGDEGGLLIGVDLEKDEPTLRAAYNDQAGVTGAFNLNLLHRMKRELGAELTVENFIHDAPYNPDERRIEMHLRSLCRQTIRLGADEFQFEEDETIHTENSHKYSLERFAKMAEDTGFRVKSVWIDPQQLFSVQYLEAAPA
jgi:dimethylhistidine N-methyltransferase